VGVAVPVVLSLSRAQADWGLTSQAGWRWKLHLAGIRPDLRSVSTLTIVRWNFNGSGKVGSAHPKSRLREERLLALFLRPG